MCDYSYGIAIEELPSETRGTRFIPYAVASTGHEKSVVFEVGVAAKV